MLKDILYHIGGILLVLGAALPLFTPKIAPWVYAIGVILFTSIQTTTTYKVNNPTIRRLHHQQLFGAAMLLVSAILLFMSVYQIKPFRGNEWGIALLIGVAFETYAIFRIDYEEKKNR